MYCCIRLCIFTHCSIIMALMHCVTLQCISGCQFLVVAYTN
jgi:hypothetical protein